MSKQESRLEVEIFGEYYTLKGDLAPEEIMMLARFVHDKMEELADRNPRLNRNHITILAALNIAEELKKIREEHDRLVKMLEEPEKKKNKKNRNN
jgi:cell division protein ZapA